MKLIVDNPKEPIPVFIKRGDVFEPLVSISNNPKKEQCFACGECGILTFNEETARLCCKRTYCECGNPIEKYLIRCYDCNYSKKLEKAQEVEYTGGAVCVFDDDRFFESIEYLIDYCIDDEERGRPEYVSPCNVEVWNGIDIENVINNELEDEYHEDAIDSLIDLNDLIKYVDAWNKKQNITTWKPDFSKKIKVVYPNE